MVMNWEGSKKVMEVCTAVGLGQTVRKLTEDLPMYILATALKIAGC